MMVAIISEIKLSQTQRGRVVRGSFFFFFFLFFFFFFFSGFLWMFWVGRICLALLSAT